MSVACSYGPLPATGVVVTAHCGLCGEDAQTVVPDEQTAATTGVDHRCGTVVVGSLWLLRVPPASRAQRARRA